MMLPMPEPFRKPLCSGLPIALRRVPLRMRAEIFDNLDNNNTYGGSYVTPNIKFRFSAVAYTHSTNLGEERMEVVWAVHRVVVVTALPKGRSFSTISLIAFGRDSQCELWLE